MSEELKKLRAAVAELDRLSDDFEAGYRDDATDDDCDFAAVKVIAEARALCSQGATPEGWQPIATAPKDGTPFIGCNIHGEIYVMLFSARLGDWAEWVHEVDPCTPTHWMPLPAPPAPASEKAGS